MSFTSRLIHDLVIEQASFDEGAPDDRGQPALAVSEVDVIGLVQPRSTRELPDSRAAGAELSTHVVFMPIDIDLGPADVIRHDARRYTVQGIRRFEFGRSPHLEVDANLVTSSTAEAVGS